MYIYYDSYTHWTDAGRARWARAPPHCGRLAARAQRTLGESARRRARARARALTVGGGRGR